jgi:mannose-1-phosphate guanylyltransferase/mannose-1-phosphate guanylyltransferase/mannose-6-phosphate isomerase
MGRITPVILSGGAGARLWPMSRGMFPKQLQPLVSERPMIVETAARTADPKAFAPPVVICNEAHRFVIGEQFRSSGIQLGRLVVEPAGRNTAPAIAAGALVALESDPEALVLALPADHLIRDIPGFLSAVARGKTAAEAGRLVTFGISPTRPETGYGYIRRGDGLDGAPGVFELAGFTEKPDAETAESYVASGEYDWNSGMFLFQAKSLLEEMRAHCPEAVYAAEAALANGQRDLDFFRLEAAAFSEAPNISLDYAVMEHTTRAAVVPCDIGWTDVGAWSELWAVGEKDGAGNVVLGDVVAEDAEGCYLRSERGLVAALGVRDLVVVATKDAVLVADRARAQDVKKIVDRLKADKRDEADVPHEIHRPWGSFQSVDAGQRYQVKRLTVKPGAVLSLQKHFHRAEHWVVVNGTARVTRDDEVFEVTENESVYLPLGCVHRLENPGKVTLNIIEVQTGSYLGEDDIVRIEDSYGRVGEKQGAKG